MYAGGEMDDGIDAAEMRRPIRVGPDIADIRTCYRPDAMAGIGDALEFIASLRINHQALQIGQGQPAENYLPPGELSELERKHLKDAFNVIQEMQNTLDHRYQLARFR